MVKFARGSYGSLTFTRSGCPVTAFLPENETYGWCLRIGTNVYTGFSTRRAAVEGVGRFI